jgi:hypothetical protein
MSEVDSLVGCRDAVVADHSAVDVAPVLNELQQGLSSIVATETRDLAKLTATTSGQNKLDLFFDLVFSANFGIAASALSSKPMHATDTLMFALVITSVFNAWMELLLFSNICQTEGQASHYMASLLLLVLVEQMAAYVAAWCLCFPTHTNCFSNSTNRFNNWPVAVHGVEAIQAFSFWGAVFQAFVAACYYHQLSAHVPLSTKLTKRWDSEHLTAYLNVTPAEEVHRVFGITRDLQNFRTKNRKRETEEGGNGGRAHQQPVVTTASLRFSGRSLGLLYAQACKAPAPTPQDTPAAEDNDRGDNNDDGGGDGGDGGRRGGGKERRLSLQNLQAALGSMKQSEERHKAHRVASWLQGELFRGERAYSMLRLHLRTMARFSGGTGAVFLAGLALSTLTGRWEPAIACITLKNVLNLAGLRLFKKAQVRGRIVRMSAALVGARLERLTLVVLAYSLKSMLTDVQGTDDASFNTTTAGDMHPGSMPYFNTSNWRVKAALYLATLLMFSIWVIYATGIGVTREERLSGFIFAFIPLHCVLIAQLLLMGACLRRIASVVDSRDPSYIRLEVENVLCMTVSSGFALGKPPNHSVCYRCACLHQSAHLAYTSHMHTSGSIVLCLWNCPQVPCSSSSFDGSLVRSHLADSRIAPSATRLV